MFFERIDDILPIATKTNCAIFVVPETEKVEIKGALTLAPKSKTTITVEQVREVIGLLTVKQTEEKYIIIRPADKMSEVAANAFLKNLEEPNEKVHFCLVTAHPSRLLPTILSRAEIYFLRSEVDFTKVDADGQDKALAKKLMTAGPKDLVKIAEEIATKKTGAREYALKIVGLAIEMLYKSYFVTGKEIFVQKLPRFLELYENLERNGHIKLHIVADLC